MVKAFQLLGRWTHWGLPTPRTALCRPNSILLSPHLAIAFISVSGLSGIKVQLRFLKFVKKMVFAVLKAEAV